MPVAGATRHYRVLAAAALAAVLLSVGIPTAQASPRASVPPPIESFHVSPDQALPRAVIGVSGHCPAAFQRVVVTIGGVEVLRAPNHPEYGFYSAFDSRLPDIEPGPTEVKGQCIDLDGRVVAQSTVPFEVLDPQVLLDELDAARRRWARHEPPSYVYDWFGSNFWATGLIRRTTVVDGAVTAVDPFVHPLLSPEEAEVVLHDNALLEAEFGPVPDMTIEDHFDEIERVIAEGPAYIRVTYDERSGIPLEVFVDELAYLADEEHWTTIENLEEITLPIPQLAPAPPAVAIPGEPTFTG